MTKPRIDKVVPIKQMRGDSTKDTRLLKGMHQEAREFLASFEWCGGIKEEFFGLGVGGIVGVFLFRIRPKANADEWIWVVVGDLPPAYLAAVEFPNPACALEGYIGAMREWVDAVKRGKNVDELIPVNAAPTTANAKELASRLKFLKEKILSRHSSDLRDR